MAFLLPLRSNSGFSGHTVWKGGAATEAIPVWHRPGGCVRVRRPSSHLCHGATGQRNSACVQKRSSKKLQKVTFSKPSFRTFFTAVMVALCTTFSSDSRVPQKAQKSSEIHRFRNFFWSECRDSNSRPLEPHSSAIPNFATPGYHIHLLHHVSLITIPHSFLFCKPYFRFFCIFYGSGSRSPTAPPPTPAGYPGTGPHPALCR